MPAAMDALNTIEAMRRRRQGGAMEPSLMASGAMPMPANPMTGLTPLPPAINVPTLPTPASPMAAPAPGGQMYGPAMQGRNFMLDRGDGMPLLPYFSKTGAAPNIPGMTAFDVGPAEGLMGGSPKDEMYGPPMPPKGGAVEGLMGGAFLNDKGNFRGILPMLFGPSLSMEKSPGDFTGLVPGMFSGISSIFGD